MSPKISIHIVAWNSMLFLPDLLDSISKQTYTDFAVLVIDNGSSDKVAEFLSEKYPHVRCLRNVRNLGFTSAHNQGIRYAIEHWDKGELQNKFIFVMNPDVVLTPTCLEELMRATHGKDAYGSFGGKLLRAYGDGIVDEVLKSSIHSDRIDSTGLQLQKNLTSLKRGAGEMDEGQYDISEDVFGISRSLVLYRAQALQTIRFQDEFFDQDFVTFKEDEDLAWRMQYASLPAWYEARAVAYHFRGAYVEEKWGWMARLQHRQTKSKMYRYYCIRNHWLVLLKNIDFVSFLLSFPQVCYTESFRFLGALLFGGADRFAIFSVMGLIPRMYKKRQWIQKTKQITGFAIRKRFAK